MTFTVHCGTQPVCWTVASLLLPPGLLAAILAALAPPSGLFRHSFRSRSWSPTRRGCLGAGWAGHHNSPPPPQPPSAISSAHIQLQLGLKEVLQSSFPSTQALLPCPLSFQQEAAFINWFLPVCSNLMLCPLEEPSTPGQLPPPPAFSPHLTCPPAHGSANFQPAQPTSWSLLRMSLALLIAFGPSSALQN